MDGIRSTKDSDPDARSARALTEVQGQEGSLVCDVLIIDVLCHDAREGMAAPQVLHERGFELL